MYPLRAGGTSGTRPLQRPRRAPVAIRELGILGMQAQRARPTFALDMSDRQREIMARHAHHWRPWAQREPGQMVIFGPVLDNSGSRD